MRLACQGSTCRAAVRGTAQARSCVHFTSAATRTARSAALRYAACMCSFTRRRQADRTSVATPPGGPRLRKFRAQHGTRPSPHHSPRTLLRARARCADACALTPQRCGAPASRPQRARTPPCAAMDAAPHAAVEDHLWSADVRVCACARACVRVRRARMWEAPRQGVLTTTKALHSRARAPPAGGCAAQRHARGRRRASRGVRGILRPRCRVG